MAVTIPFVGDGGTLRLFSRKEYDALIEMGFFNEDDHVELLRGVLVEMCSQGVPHVVAVSNLNMLLTPALAGRAEVRIQSPIAVSDDSEPEPDVAVVEAGRWTRSLPDTALLVVEVARSSHRRDRGVKAELYAAAGVPDYWIVDLEARTVEVRRGPHPDGTWDSLEVHGSGDSVALLAFPDVALAVDAVLPPAN